MMVSGNMGKKMEKDNLYQLNKILQDIGKMDI